MKFDSTGKFLFAVSTYPNGLGPIGVGVDGDGNLWTVNQVSNNATKMKLDGTIIGYYRVGYGPYTYSDMTGFNLQNITTHEGTWTQVQDGGEENYKWTSINWHEQKPMGTEIIVSARAANQPGELAQKQYVQIQNGAAVSLSGRYIQVEVKLKTANLQTPVLEDIAVNGVPVIKAVNKVRTDRLFYGPNENVYVVETVNNISYNSSLKDLSVNTSIVDARGAQVWRMPKALTEIPLKGGMTIQSTWYSAQYTPGDYTVISQVYQYSRKLCEARTTFKIVAVERVTGNLEVKTKTIYPADDAIFDYTVTNTGNVSLNNLTARISVVDPATNTVVAAIYDVFGLGLNETVKNTRTWAREALKIGTYRVVLEAIFANGQEVFLDSDELQVTKPYETTISRVVRPRVLVWAESQANIELARRTLDNMQIFYKIVNTRDTFMTELRTGQYNLYMLLDSKLPLTGHDDEELAAEVAGGKGIIASRDGNGDNLKKLGLFGVEFRGSTTPHDLTVDLPADSVFGQLTLSNTGKAQRVELNGGEQLASLNSNKGTSPGIVASTYEKGKSLLFTFDIGTCSGDTESVLRKAVELTMPADDTTKGYAELEIKVTANTAVAAEIKLNIPEGAEVIWVSPEADGWNFATEKGQEFTFRTLVKLPQTAGPHTVTVDSYYLTANGMLNFDNNSLD
ncbi:MAG TPA: hypothetical protein VHS59_14895 [Bacillota bacterium]|nr:hypothetical protein [Bacillota bacterium]